MTKSEIDAIKKRNAEVSAMIEECEGALQEWAGGQKKLAKRFMERLGLYRKVAGELSSDWGQYACAQYCFGKLFGQETRKVAEFRKSDSGRSLPPSTAAQVRALSRLPWYYSVFSVTEIVDGDLMRIKEWVHGEERLLESEGVRNSHASGVNLFMTLLFDNGLCMQTYGLLHYYRGYSPIDFAYLAGVLKERPQEMKDVAAAIEQHPVEFMLMDRYSEIPPTRVAENDMHFIASSIPARTFQIHDPKGAFAQDESGGVKRYSLKAAKGPNGAWLYHDTGNAELWALSIGPNHYETLRSAADAALIPPRPQWQATMTGVIFVNALLDKEFPGLWFETLFTQEHSTSPEEERALASLNAFIAEVMDHRNHGREYTIEDAALKHGVDPTTAKSIVASLDEQMKKTSFAIEGGIPGFVPPAPAVRQSFADSFARGHFLTFNASSRAQQLHEEAVNANAAMHRFSTRSGPLADLADLIEGDYHKTFDTPDAGILLFCIYLLLEKGDQLIPIRNYAIETLRLFGQVLLPANDPSLVSTFLLTYADMGFRTLIKHGLVETDEKVELTKGRPTSDCYGIRRTAFFDEWIGGSTIRI